MDDNALSLEQMTFNCGHCGKESSLIDSVAQYGIIFLFGEDDGYYGLVCPKCLLTNLKCAHIDKIESLKHKLLFVAGYGESLDKERLRYNSFPYNLDYLPDYVPSPIIYYLKILSKDTGRIKKKEVEHLYKKNPELISSYCSYEFENLAMGPNIMVWWYDKRDIQTLIEIENELEFRVFPRYMFYDPLRTSIENFCWHYDLNGMGDYDGLFGPLFNWPNFIEDISSPPYPVPEYASMNSALFSILEYVPLQSDGLLPWYNEAELHFPDRHRDILDNKLEYIERPSTKHGLTALSCLFIREYYQRSHQTIVSHQSLIDFKNRHLSNLISWVVTQEGIIADQMEALQLEYNFLGGVGQYRACRTIDPITYAKEYLPSDIDETMHLDKRYSFLKKIVTQDNGMMWLKNFLVNFARYNIDFLILGEIGTGKELVARAIHQVSDREGNFVPINCSAIPKELFESELFGHKKGSFSGAYYDKKGAFEYANHGTLFLDEIGEMPLELQPKLLRAIEYREIKPLGSESPFHVDTKLVFATNRDLKKEAEVGNFRKDLFYRIFSPSIKIPPLSERGGDIPLLADYFREQFNERFNKHVKFISPGVIATLRKHPWEGNVRELMKGIEMAVINSNGEVITEKDLPDFLREQDKKDDLEDKKDLPPATKITDDEIVYWMKKLDYKKSKVAKKLGVTYRTILRRCIRLGILLPSSKL